MRDVIYERPLNLEQEYSSGPTQDRKPTISKVSISPNPGVNYEESWTFQGWTCLFAQVWKIENIQKIKQEYYQCFIFSIFYLY